MPNDLYLKRQLQHRHDVVYLAAVFRVLAACEPDAVVARALLRRADRLLRCGGPSITNAAMTADGELPCLACFAETATSHQAAQIRGFVAAPKDSVFHVIMGFDRVKRGQLNRECRRFAMILDEILRSSCWTDIFEVSLGLLRRRWFRPSKDDPRPFVAGLHLVGAVKPGEAEAVWELEAHLASEYGHADEHGWCVALPVADIDELAVKLSSADNFLPGYDLDASGGRARTRRLVQAEAESIDPRGRSPYKARMIERMKGVEVLRFFESAEPLLTTLVVHESDEEEKEEEEEDTPCALAPQGRPN
jgi:hypothetical protein